MEHTDLTGIAPNQYTGKEIIAEVSQECDNVEEAKQLYAEAKKRLMDVNRWSQTGGLPGAQFQLMDSDGDESDRPVQQYDYFRIQIPGPPTREGDGYDWVYVEEFDEVDADDSQSTAFRVRPTSNPESSSTETAHFYSKESTSTFIVSRQQKKVSVVIVDRNIKPNDEATSPGDRLRDKIFALGGISGLSKMQWQSLAKGILDTAVQQS